MDKKPRSDSKLDNLPEHQFLALRDGLLKRRFKSYDEALSWLAAECGVDSSAPALSGFFRKHCSPVIKQRRSIASMKAEAWGDACEGEASLDAGILERLKQIVFEVIDTEDPKPKDVKALVDSFAKVTGEARKDRQLELDERKLKLLEEKAAQNDQAKEVLGSSLSPAEQNRRLKEILK